MSVHRALRLLERSGLAVLVAALILVGLMQGRAQTLVPERTYPYLQADVEQALQDLGAYSGARLPVLEGFVTSLPALPGRFERPYYQFQIQVVCLAAGRTLVRVSAKITAWYVDPDPSRSEYRTLPSSGRLEADLFDRLEAYLKKKGSDSLPVKPEPCTAPKTPLAGAVSRPLPGLRPAVSPPGNSTADPPSAASTSEEPTAPPAPTESLDAEIARVRSQRGEAEKRVAELTAEVSQLEESLRRQISPSNLAAVKAARAAVREQPADATRILFWADAEDEFEVLENRGDWAQVGFGTDPQGWVRTSQLDLGGNGREARSGTTRVPEDDHGFSVAREQVNPFSGEWSELKGKLALFVWARSEGEGSDSASGQEQLAFAKRIFLDRYREARHSEQGYAGVVVIFLGPRGGVAAATLAQIQRWDEGGLSDTEFLKRCSLDPPEAFRGQRSP